LKWEKLLFISLLITSLFVFGLIITSVLGMSMFNQNSLGFQYLFFMIFFSFIYFAFRYLKNFDALIIDIFLALIYAYLINQTSLSEKFGAFWQIILYSLLLFSTLAVVFRFTWFNIRSIRNISFAILSGFGYMVVHILVSLTLKIAINSQFIITYFTNGFILMLTISFGISIAEIIFSKIIKPQPENILDEDEIDD